MPEDATAALRGWRALYDGMPFSSSRGALGWSAVLIGSTADAGVVLFDTGGPGDRLTLPDRLHRQGLVAADVDLVVLSHLHFDHAHNWDLFTRARIVVAERELAHAEEGEDWAVLRHVVDPLRRTGRLTEVTGRQRLDDRLEVVPAPGHTPGSLVLDAGGTVLCGDALKDRWQLARALSGDPAGHDQTERTIAALAAEATVLWPGHDGPLQRHGEGWSGLDEARLHLSRADGQRVDVHRERAR